MFLEPAKCTLCNNEFLKNIRNDVINFFSISMILHYLGVDMFKIYFSSEA